MRIEFYCTCGKKLRAKKEMAGRRTMCPQCGRPVGIPTHCANHTGGDALSLSLERRPAPRTEPDPVVAQQTIKAVPRKTRRSIIRWTNGFAYTFGQIHVIACLSVLSAIPIAIWVSMIPSGHRSSGVSWSAALGLLVGSAAVVCVQGFGIRYILGVASTAIRGSRKAIGFPNLDPAEALYALGQFSLIALCGPFFGFLAILAYLLNVGDLDWIDRVLLSELSIVTVGYFILSMVLFLSEGTKSLLPTRVLHFGACLGWRFILLSATSWLFLTLFAYGFVMCCELIQVEAISGSVLMSILFLSGFVVASFTARVVGLLYYNLPLEFDRIPRWALVAGQQLTSSRQA